MTGLQVDFLEASPFLVAFFGLTVGFIATTLGSWMIVDTEVMSD